MNRILIVILLFCNGLIQHNFAQETGIEPENQLSGAKHRVGFSTGTTSGVGVMYAYKPSKLQIQGVAFPNVRPNNAYLQAGLNFSYDIKNYKFFDLFLFENNRVIYSNYTYNDYYYDAVNGYVSYLRKEEQVKIAHGVGMGLRFDFLEHLGIQIMTGFASYNYNQLSMTADGGLYFIL